jgi:uncharacterized protein (TIGR00369 family)
MRKIRNPFVELEGYNCFGCSPGNEDGLHLDFHEDGDELVSVWNPRPSFHGYRNVLHGGIQATLLDEIASWVVYVKLQTAGMTSRMNVRYFRPVYVDHGELTIRARVKDRKRNLAEIEAKLFDRDQNLCSEALVTYFTFSQEKSKSELFYPSPEDFYFKE